MQSAWQLKIATAAFVSGCMAFSYAATIFPNSKLDIVGPLGSPVTNIGVSGGPSAADSWTQDAIVQDRFLSTEMLTSTDPFVNNSGLMMRALTNAPWTGSAGSGIGVNAIGDPLPVGSVGSVDININPGTTVLLGWVVNTRGGTRFDVGSVLVSASGGWQRVFFTNDTTETGTFEIEVFTFPVGAAGGFDVDNLQFTAATPSPEPGSSLLLAAGLIGIAALRT